MSRRKANLLYAPEGTCRSCGFTGQDWGFKYHWNYCSKCYEKWKKQQRAERKKMRTNENINITDDIIVTENVKKRLHKKANTAIPFSKKFKIFDKLFYIGGPISVALSIYALTSEASYSWIFLIAGAILMIISIHGFDHITTQEAINRNAVVDNELIELAKIRKKQIEEAKRFYASPEWQHLRQKIINSHKNICKNCGKTITEKNDITIDHILPRSKFPENELEMSNMQILCRSCNSSKGNKIIDMIDT